VTVEARPRARFFLEPFDDLAAAMDAQVARAPRPYRALVIVVLAGAAAWWVYVPVHELLHALGCVVTGGRVTELQIAPRYGGTLLARVFPFVVGDGSYAGRLSGFDTKGSDLIYLATDAMPYVLTVLIGVPLLKACGRAGRPALLGPAFVLALAPFYSLTGDYYEMGSIISTRVVGMLRGTALPPYRSDDVIQLAADILTRPAQFGIANSGGAAAAGGIIAAGLAVGVLLALATYAAGARWSGSRRGNVVAP
jgi:hypothetical protein